ncbi:MAG: hydantoinase/oxoprolinase N-terminal domain-containing protein, partial [Pseudomonadota bacterium]
MPRRLGIDMRATRTDVLLYDEQTGASDILKIAMDPADPGSALTQGLEALVRMAGISAGDIDHAAVSLPPEVFDNPARTGLLVTQGFEQSLPHRAGADAALARGVPERCLANGNVSHELDEEAAERSIRQLLGQGINALAICLMHAPRNPAHEVRLEEIALACDASLRVALSHRVAHGGGEAARARAVLLAAGTSASVDACLSAVEAGLSGAQMSPSLRVVQSTGDCLDRAAAVQQPARLPAAGAASAVAAAAKAAAAAGHQKAVSLNIGSTAATGALIRQGRARIADATAVGDGDGTVPLPSVDLRDIGSGLNAVASAPFPGMVRVGPAHARPACQGGEAATVMDALAVLKRLPLAALSLDGTAAESAVAKVAAAMGAGLHETAAA